jgi:hypothetical protein
MLKATIHFPAYMLSPNTTFLAVFLAYSRLFPGKTKKHFFFHLFTERSTMNYERSVNLAGDM